MMPRGHPGAKKLVRVGAGTGRERFAIRRRVGGSASRGAAGQREPQRDDRPAAGYRAAQNDQPNDVTIP